MTKNEWQTPPRLFGLLNEEFKFNLDAACTIENCLCEYGLHVEDTDALTTNWNPLKKSPFRVFLNPPYGRGMLEKFCMKSYDETRNNCTVVALLPCDCSTKWFQRYVMMAHEIRFINSRVRFIDPTTGKRSGSPTFGSMIVVWRPGPRIMRSPWVTSYDW